MESVHDKEIAVLPCLWQSHKEESQFVLYLNVQIWIRKWRKYGIFAKKILFHDKNDESCYLRPHGQSWRSLCAKQNDLDTERQIEDLIDVWTVKEMHFKEPLKKIVLARDWGEERGREMWGLNGFAPLHGKENQLLIIYYQRVWMYSPQRSYYCMRQYIC